MRRLRSLSDSFSSCRRLHRHHHPLGVQRVREALADAHELLRLSVRGYRNQEPVAREPRARGCGALRGESSAAASTRSAVRRSASSRSASRFGLPEEPLGGRADLVGHIDLAGLQARQQVVRRQVDELDLVGLVENAVRQGLLLPHAGDPGDDVVEALEMLDIERRPDVDAGVEQLLHVLPALGVTRQRLALGDVRVREFVDEQVAGSRASAASRSNSRRDDAAVADLEERQLLQPFEQPLGLDAPVRLDVADHDVGPPARALRAASSIE